MLQISLKKILGTIEDLIRKRERNIKLASVLRDVTKAIKGRAKNWREIIQKLKTKYPSDVVEALTIIGNSKSEDSEEYQDACKLLEAKINNLESNLHIEIDMERIEDRSKALSYIGIEIAEALKYIPAPAVEFTKEAQKQMVPQEKIKEIASDVVAKVAPVNEVAQELAEVDTEEISNDFGTKVEETQVTEVDEEPEMKERSILEHSVAEEIAEQDTSYIQETRFEVKKSLWQRIKTSKLVRTISYIMKIRVVLDYPALPEGNLENR